MVSDASQRVFVAKVGIVLRLILRFERDDLVEPVLGVAYMPLIRSGHTGDARRFRDEGSSCAIVSACSCGPGGSRYRVADGAFELASRIAQRAVDATRRRS